MAVRQISVFIENRAGTLVEVTEVIAKAGVNIRAVSLADTTNFGIMRVIVDKPELCEKALNEEGYTVSITQVLAIGLRDNPGGLHDLAKLTGKNGINLDYIYAYVSHASGEACIIARVAELEKAEALLKDAGFRVYSEDEAYNL